MENEKMIISIVQSEIYWENVAANLGHFEEMLSEAPKSDIIVLSEMFTTGFTMNPAPMAEVVNQSTTKWMVKMAKRMHSCLVGSFVCKDKNQYYNRLAWVFPNGEIQYYDKHHLFSIAGETNTYSSGNERIVIEWKGWKFLPLICYDLRFPEWSRNFKEEIEYDCLVYCANWPKSRVEAWNTLLKARAIENLSYCVGVNRIGIDGNNIEYSGNSGLYDFKGKSLVNAAEKEGVFTIELNKNELNKFRAAFPTYLDMDK